METVSGGGIHGVEWYRGCPSCSDGVADDADTSTMMPCVCLWAGGGAGAGLGAEATARAAGQLGVHHVMLLAEAQACAVINVWGVTGG